jgi:protein involved in polysaccharide export with SLBB domain
MFKNVLLAACAVVVLGSAGCSLRDRHSYVMPPPKQAAPADYSRPALMAPAPILPISTNSPAAAVRPVAKPAPALPVPAPVAAARKDSAATATMSSSTAYHLKAGDPVVIYLRGIPGVPGGEQQIEDIIDENGAMSMPYLGTIQAGGKTSTELEQTIQKTYIDQQIYKYITVNVVVPSRSYYVRGEIRQPGRFQLLSRVTVNQAIAAAGGFTEFANPSKVEILRGSQRMRVDAAEFAKHPDRDKELESGDVIIVHRSFF